MSGLNKIESLTKCIVGIVILLLFSTIAIAQTDLSSEEDIKVAASQAFESKKYNESKSLYSRLLSLHPNHWEYNFKYGASLIFTERDKEESIRFIKAALEVPHTDNRVEYYAGLAYHVNYEFDNAIKYYELFKAKASSPELEQLDIELQINMCKNGKELLSTINEIAVIENNPIRTSDFYRSYKLEDIGGKIIVKPDQFKTKKDQENEQLSVVYLAPESSEVYFSSYGETDKNGKDIYVVRKKEDGEYGEPQSIGAPVNTKYDEDFPFMHPNGRTLYFSSNGHTSMGGYDLFKSEYIGGVWSEPINVDFAFSSTGNDFLFVSDANDELAYFASDRESKEGYVNVYKVKVKREPANYIIINGTFENEIEPEKRRVTISLINPENGLVLGQYYTDATNGHYNLYLLDHISEYKIIVETKAGNPIHEKRFKAPLTNGVVTYEQELKLVQGAAGEELQMLNKFDQSVPSTSSEIAGLIKQKSKLRVNVTEADIKDRASKNEAEESTEKIAMDDVPLSEMRFEDMTNEQLVQYGNQQAELLESESIHLSTVQNESYWESQQKILKARENYKESEELIGSLGATKTEEEKEAKKVKAARLEVEANQLVKESKVLQNYASTFDAAIEDKRLSAQNVRSISKTIQESLAKANRDEAIAQAQKQRFFVETSEQEDDGADYTPKGFKRVYDESRKKTEESRTVYRERVSSQQELEQELNTLQEQYNTEKKKKVKEDLQERIMLARRDLDDLIPDLVASREAVKKDSIAEEYARMSWSQSVKAESVLKSGGQHNTVGRDGKDEIASNISYMEQNGISGEINDELLARAQLKEIPAIGSSIEEIETLEAQTAEIVEKPGVLSSKEETLALNTVSQPIDQSSAVTKTETSIEETSVKNNEDLSTSSTAEKQVQQAPANESSQPKASPSSMKIFSDDFQKDVDFSNQMVTDYDKSSDIKYQGHVYNKADSKAVVEQLSNLKKEAAALYTSLSQEKEQAYQIQDQQLQKQALEKVKQKEELYHQKQLEIANEYAKANKAEYATNKAVLQEYAKNYSDESAEIDVANLYTDEADHYFKQAYAIRQNIDPNSPISEQELKLQKAYNFELQAMIRQNKARAAYERQGGDKLAGLAESVKVDDNVDLGFSTAPTTEFNTEVLAQDQSPVNQQTTSGLTDEVAQETKVTSVQKEVISADGLRVEGDKNVEMVEYPDFKEGIKTIESKASEGEKYLLEAEMLEAEVAAYDEDMLDLKDKAESTSSKKEFKRLSVEASQVAARSAEVQKRAEVARQKANEAGVERIDDENTDLLFTKAKMLQEESDELLRKAKLFDSRGEKTKDTEEKANYAHDAALFREMAQLELEEAEEIYNKAVQIEMEKQQALLADQSTVIKEPLVKEDIESIEAPVVSETVAQIPQQKEILSAEVKDDFNVERIKNSANYDKYKQLQDLLSQLSGQMNAINSLSADLQSEVDMQKAEASKLREKASIEPNDQQKEEYLRAAVEFENQAELVQARLDSVNGVSTQLNTVLLAKQKELDSLKESVENEALAAKETQPKQSNQKTSTTPVKQNVGSSVSFKEAFSNDFSLINGNQNFVLSTQKNASAYNQSNPIPMNTDMPDGVVFAVQVGAFKNPISQDVFRGFAPIRGQTSATGITRYTAGLFKNRDMANEAKNQIRVLGYSDAFVVAFVNGEKISMTQAQDMLSGKVPVPQPKPKSTVSKKPSGPPIIAENVTQITGLFYTIQVGVFKGEVSGGVLKQFKNLHKEITSDGNVRYSFGKYNTLDDAYAAVGGIMTRGISDAFVTAYYNGERISVQEAETLKNNKGKNVISDKATTAHGTSHTNSFTGMGTEYRVKLGEYQGEIPVETAGLYLKLVGRGVKHEDTPSGVTIYTIGSFQSETEANELKQEMIDLGFTEASVIKR